MPAPTPQQLRRLVDALVDALRDRDQIEFFLWYHLGRNISRITEDAKIDFMLYRVAKDAQQNGWLDALLDATVTAYPQVIEFSTLRTELLPPPPSRPPLNPWSVCLFRGGRSFIDREELRLAVRELEQDDGPRILIVQGDEGTGKESKGSHPPIWPRACATSWSWSARWCGPRKTRSGCTTSRPSPCR